MIAVLNPEQRPVVEVDLSRVLKPGQKFRIVSVKDFYGTPIVSGMYDGRPVQFPMKPITPLSPVGLPSVELPVIEPRFAAFVVLPEDE